MKTLSLIGLASIIATLRNKGANVSVIDAQIQMNSLNEISNEITSRQPDYLGFSAYTEEIIDSARIAQSVKSINSNLLEAIRLQSIGNRKLRKISDEWANL